ncbi:ATP-binding protein [Massilia aquatica]|uniref:histidine kinase n=1 Tax=Massilia aquatica TaxID=2609000 RepID=A0ABX0MJ16_9BURK|nr:ATP-binding protein [Massilia aquatica]NHZ44400.1 GAF domain-containing protein [Massilia aquatica]
MSADTAPQTAIVTLQNCADEPIHVPGNVQAHGAMLVFDAGARLEAWSANVGTLLLMEPGMGMPLQAVGLPAPIAQMVQECLALCAGDAIPWMLAVHIGGREFDCVAHAHLGRVIVEFELRDVSLDEVGIFALKAHSALDRLKRQTTVTSLLQMATDQVREITGFDRVMGYRFAQDGSGDVIAESRSASLAPLLGMRYPASDIPAQARRLYVINTLRLIPDVKAAVVPVLGRDGSAAVDMSHCVLRSVSPVHIEYLNNMGVGASMSVSIIVDGCLWGLIACHHMSARRVPYAIRMTADVIAQVLAATVQTLEAQRRTETIALAADMRSNLMQSLLMGEDTLRDVAVHAGAMCDALQCPALIVTQSGRHVAHGAIDALTAAVIARAHPLAGDLLLERRQVSDWPESARAHIAHWPGMLAICFDPPRDGWIMALRPEQIASIRWAGKPEKILRVGPLGGRLTPRGSFDEWLETVRGRAEGWSATHLAIARQMQDELHRASIARQTETDLARAQLMAMLGHDLREPLQAIQMAAAVLQQGGAAAPIGLRIQRSSSRMNRLISQVLDMSKIQMGVGLGAQMRRLDLATVIGDVVDEAMTGHPDVCYRLVADAGALVEGDADRLAQLASNLLSNARSHGERTAPIDIVVAAGAKEATFSVSNVAEALDQAAVRSLYQPFKAASLHNAHNRGGMGLGLYIAERIVTEHGGTLAYAHAQGRVTFTVTLALATGAGG